MLRMVTAYKCQECGNVWTRAEALEAGPLVKCECGEQYERGTLGGCLGCQKQDGGKILSKVGCPTGCCVGVTPVRRLRITERQRYDGTWRETGDGSLLVRVTAGDLKRMAKEAPDA